MGLREERWVRLLVDTSAYALPVALGRVGAADGTIVALEATGEGRWPLDGAARPKALGAPRGATPESRVRHCQSGFETLWRLYTRGIDPTLARGRARIDGDRHLADAILSARAIIA